MSELTFDQHRARLSHLSTADGRIAYFDLGPRDGHPVLLVHGMPTSSWLYRTIGADLAAAGLRAIGVDLLGFGASDKPRDHSVYRPERQATRLTELLDHLGLPAATFVAHDLGGPWTFEVADHSPQRISSLVILNTSAYAELMSPPREARMVGGPFGPIMLTMMASRVGRSFIHKFFSDFTGRQTTLSRNTTEGYWTPLHEGGTIAFRAFAVRLDRLMAEFARYAAALRRLNVPATVIWGTEDPVLRPERLVPRFAADLRIAEPDIHLLDRASHFLQEDRPHDVASLITTFIAHAHPSTNVT